VLDPEARIAAASERAQLIEALVEVASECGYTDTSIEMVIARAGLDRPAFDRHFRGKYDSFLSAWQEMNEECMACLGVEAALEELDRGSNPPDRYRRPVAAIPADTPVENGEEYPPELARLPPGRHGLPREFVAHNQRERLIAGLAEAIAENGYAGTTIAHITRHAAVSRRTFYEHFSSKDECFVAAYDTVMAELRERVGQAFDHESDWPHAVKAGIGAMLRFLAAEPNLARLCMVEALVAGPVVVERYDSAIQSFVPYFQTGREGRSPEVLARLSPTTEEALVGGMMSLISRRIIAGKTAELESLLPDLVEFTLTPYLGSEDAAEIARES
jgi:AcrR family transcriptional regulator